MRRRLIGTVAITMVWIAMLVLMEVVLRLTGRPSAPVIGWTSSGRPGEQNQIGFRGHRFDPTADVRVVLLGDSQVEAYGVALDDMPERQLRRTVSELMGTTVSVLSIGSSGWGQDQELLALQAHINAVRPSAVVLWFSEANDVWNNTFPTHFPKDGSPKPTFWLEGTKLAGPNLPWLEAYRPPGLYLAQGMRRLRSVPVYPTDAEWEPRLPPAYRASMLSNGAVSLVKTLSAWRGVRVDEVPYFSDENFDTEKTHYNMYLVPESPRLTYSAALTRALLLRIRDLCEANGAKFFILIAERLLPIPDPPTMFEVKGKGYWLSSAARRALIARMMEGLPTIRVTGTPRDAVISKTDGHLNAEGNKYVMDWLGRRLASELR
jgi:hypothetical protein